MGKAIPVQGRRKHLKLGGGAWHLEGTFAFRKTRHFLKIERAFLCLLQNLGGTCPSASRFLRLCTCRFLHNIYKQLQIDIYICVVSIVFED